MKTSAVAMWGPLCMFTRAHADTKSSSSMAAGGPWRWSPLPPPMFVPWKRVNGSISDPPHRMNDQDHEFMGGFQKQMTNPCVLSDFPLLWASAALREIFSFIGWKKRLTRRRRDAEDEKNDHPLRGLTDCFSNPPWAKRVMPSSPPSNRLLA